MWKTTNGLGQPVTWYSEATVKKLIDALEEIRELHIACKDCDFDCMYCSEVKPEAFEVADKALNEVQNG